MFGPLGWQEILLILVLALLIFGPRRLPELGRTLGRGLAEFRRASSDLKRTLNAELALEDDERTPAPRRPEIAAPDRARSPGQSPDRPSEAWTRPDPADPADPAAVSGPPAATTPRGPAPPDEAEAEPESEPEAEAEPREPPTTH